MDGDTFDVTAGYRIRLADIDCPERARRDMNGEGDRIVCMAYLKFNESHFLNINQAMLESGYAMVDDIPNSFRPLDWRLYTPMLRGIKYENLSLYSGLSAVVFTGFIYLLYWRLSIRLSKLWQKWFNKDSSIVEKP